MGTTYMNFGTGVFHVDGDAPLTQDQVDSVWLLLPTTGASWVERSHLFVQQRDGAVAFDLGPVEHGVRGVSDSVRLHGKAGVKKSKPHHSTRKARRHATKKKSPAQLDREINEALEASGARRYMLVDNKTGKDMRVAHDFEVKEIQSKRHGVAILRLGGGWIAGQDTPAKLYEVRLRDTKAPKKKTGPVPDEPGTTIKSRLFYLGEIDLGKLYVDDHRSYRTLEQALADVKPRGWRRHNSVIVETQQLVRHGVNYGARNVLHSIRDGQILDDTSW